jgi:4-hydroxybenzoate polyprenyltransferase
MTEPPLVVDLDGTLVRTDILLELALAYIRHHPFGIFRVLVWCFQGKAILKCKLAEVGGSYLDVAQLPYTPEVLSFMKAERSKGRSLVLATGSPKVIALKIKEHLGCFDEVLATDTSINLVGPKKRNALCTLFGDKNFDYMGNSFNDLNVWKAARYAYVVNPTYAVHYQLHTITNCKEVFLTPSSSRFTLWCQQLRLYQWFKNLLIFVPLLAKHALVLPALLQAASAFVLWSLCASGLYLLNDLLDITHDRHHPRKSTRPFASGKLSALSGILVAITLLIASFLGAFLFLPLSFFGALGAYAGIALLYTFSLKKMVLMDVLTLSILYTLRIIAGAYACFLPLSFWTLIFSLFLFISLAFMKRYSELQTFSDTPGILRGRGYHHRDQPIIGVFGITAGYVAVLVFGLYIHSTSPAFALYRPELIWPACALLLFWISHLWLITYRGMMHDDPLIFTLKDRTSLISMVLFFAIVWWLTL